MRRSRLATWPLATFAWQCSLASASPATFGWQTNWGKEEERRRNRQRERELQKDFFKKGFFFFFFVVAHRTYLRITKGAEQRLVSHFWYTEWPDHGVPTNLANVLRMLKVGTDSL